MSTRDWKLGEVVYLKSGSPAMTVIGTDQHGATKVQWYDPQAVEVERSVYPTNVFPKDCLTDAEVPVRMPSSDLGAFRVPQLQAEPIRVVAPQSSNEDLRQLILETLNGWIRETKRETSALGAQPNEKIVEAMSRAAEQQAQRQAQIPPILGAIQKAANASLDPAAREFREKAVASGALPDGNQPVQQPPRRKG